MNLISLCAIGFVVLFTRTNAKTNFDGKNKANVLKSMSFCYTRPNTELLLGSNSLYVTYPGLPKTNLTDQNLVKLKVYSERDENTPVINFNIITKEKYTENTYQFVLPSEIAKSGRYSSQICIKESTTSDKEICSKKSSPTTEMDTGYNCDGQYHFLTCRRTLKDDSQIELIVTLTPVSGLLSDAEMTELKSNDKTHANKYNFEKSQYVLKVEGDWWAYFAIKYPVRNFRKFARMDDYCERKYNFVILTYIASNNRVLRVGRLTPNMPKTLYGKYFGINREHIGEDGQYKYEQKNIRKVPLMPIELFFNVGDLANWNGVDREVYFIPCLVRKDGAESGITRCAPPYHAQWNFEKRE